jgi:hypothetical protein
MAGPPGRPSRLAASLGSCDGNAGASARAAWQAPRGGHRPMPVRLAGSATCRVPMRAGLTSLRGIDPPSMPGAWPRHRQGPGPGPRVSIFKFWNWAYRASAAARALWHHPQGPPPRRQGHWQYDKEGGRPRVGHARAPVLCEVLQRVSSDGTRSLSLSTLRNPPAVVSERRCSCSSARAARAAILVTVTCKHFTNSNHQLVVCGACQ